MTVIKKILFNYNVQHDCRFAKCTTSGKQAIIQERVQSEKTEVYIEHQPVNRYLVNTHAFHNAHLIRATLPRDLTVPIPYTNDRQVHHNQMAIKLQASQASKRVAMARKAEEKRNTKKSQATLASKKRKQTCSGSDDSESEGVRIRPGMELNGPGVGPADGDVDDMEVDARPLIRSEVQFQV